MVERNVDDVACTMITSMASYVEDGMLVHVGVSTFLGTIAAVLAKATTAPNANLVAVSTSGYSANPFVMTLSMLEPMAMTVGPPVRVTDIYSHVEQLEGCEYEPVIPAQIDAHGNVNLSIIGGTYEAPQVRLPGAAGLDTLSVMLRGKMRFYTTRHTRDTFVETLSFQTAAGYLTGPGAREAAGISGTGGPGTMVSDLGVFDWNSPSLRMRAVSLHEGVTADQVADRTGFPIEDLTDGLPTTPAPTLEQRRMIERVDPFGIRRLEFLSGKRRRAAVEEVLAAEEHLLQLPPAEALGGLVI